MATQEKETQILSQGKPKMMKCALKSQLPQLVMSGYQSADKRWNNVGSEGKSTKNRSTADTGNWRIDK